MNIMTNLRVHIAPIGFEVDRIVIPAREQRADRIWLLTPKVSSPIHKFKSDIKKQLKSHNIEIKETVHDRADPFDIIRATRQIIQQESGNNIFVNLSSGSKIQAVGCMLACMMFNDKRNVNSYYVEPKRYNQDIDGPLSAGVQKILPMPGYDIQVPNKLLVGTLHLIHESGRIKKKDLLAKMQSRGLAVIHPKPDPNLDQGGNVILIRAKPGSEAVVGLTRLNHKVITPLQEWGFVKVDQIGRSSFVSLTDKGENATKFLPKS